MHDEHKARAVVAALEGQRVAVVAETLPAAQAICSELADLLDADPGRVHTVRRTNGAHSIDFAGGGSIVFLSFRSSLVRGRSLDRIFVPIGSNVDYVRQLSPCLAVSGGPFVGY